MKDKNIEIRNVQNIEFRKNEDGTNSRTVEGYAVRFNTPSQDLGFIETISPEAISQETIDKSDIYARLNHDENTVLARSRYGKGSLNLELREDGLFYSFECPNTNTGNELIEHLNRGEIFGSSFAMLVGDDTWTKRGDKYYRTINNIKLLADISPVYEPAYLDTTSELRSKEKMEEIDAEILTKLDEKMKEVDSLCENLPLSD